MNPETLNQPASALKRHASKLISTLAVVAALALQNQEIIALIGQPYAFWIMVGAVIVAFLSHSPIPQGTVSKLLRQFSRSSTRRVEIASRIRDFRTKRDRSQ